MSEIDKYITISKSEMVLLAAYENWPDSGFTAEELVVACWQKYPTAFGLQGYADKYPDSNVIYRYIMGKDSIVKKQRWFSQKGQKRYVLTVAGINHALKISGVMNAETEAQRRRIDRFYEHVLLRVLNSSAWNKYASSRVEELIFTDACGFWSINPRSSGEQYRSARRDLAEAISTAKRYIDNRHTKLALGSRFTIDLRDLNQIELLERELESRFKEQLDLINHRSIRWGKST